MEIQIPWGIYVQLSLSKAYSARRSTLLERYKSDEGGYHWGYLME